MFLPKKILQDKLRKFLEEDVGQGDITTTLTVPPGTVVEAEVVAKEAGIIAGMKEAETFLESLGLQTEALTLDGSKIKEKTVIFKIVGDARTLLSTERTLLNLLSRMSGIATFTNQLVKKVQNAGYKTRIACTRKVAPGLSYFDKKAVMQGGGDTHRLHLDDLVLIKDNHLAIVEDISQAVKKVRQTVSFSKKIEVEVSTPEDAIKVAEAEAEIIMLDNFSPQQIKKTITLLEKQGLRNQVLVEASGGINRKNILDFAATGVDIVSLGEITYGAKPLDMSLEVTHVRKVKS
ncbi:MAG: carboxylating nicotinate-nucleotide diphosphorylase [Thermoproteota archaeon]|nr:carboxylating nicotinate-nucleotide diphosphorylase [Thermoproteota archaeon]